MRENEQGSEEQEAHLPHFTASGVLPQENLLKSHPAFSEQLLAGAPFEPSLGLRAAPRAELWQSRDRRKDVRARLFVAAQLSFSQVAAGAHHINEAGE